jgi:hypothetical protein
VNDYTEREQVDAGPLLRPETAALLHALSQGEEPDGRTAQCFGLLTPAHVYAVRSALSRGEVTPAEFDAGWRDAAELLRLIGFAPSGRFAALGFWVPPDGLPPDRGTAAFAALGERHRRFSESALGEWLSSLGHERRADLLEEEVAAWAGELGIGNGVGSGPAGGAL